MGRPVALSQAKRALRAFCGCKGTHFPQNGKRFRVFSSEDAAFSSGDAAFLRFPGADASASWPFPRAAGPSGGLFPAVSSPRRAPCGCAPFRGGRRAARFAAARSGGNSKYLKKIFQVLGRKFPSTWKYFPSAERLPARCGGRLGRARSLGGGGAARFRRGLSLMRSGVSCLGFNEFLLAQAKNGCAYFSRK